MKAILSSRRYHYLAMVGTFLAAIALIVGMAACTEEPRPDRDLEISSSEGGSVIEPGEGTFTYPVGTEVELIAEAEPGHYFAEWTGDVDSIADPFATETTITMNQDYSIEPQFLEGDVLCIDFEDFSPTAEYGLNETFLDEHTTVTVEPFQWGDGTWCHEQPFAPNCGDASVQDNGQAGGSGQEMYVKRVNLRFDFGSSRERLSLLFFESIQGRINIEINGEFQNVDNFEDLPSSIGGVDIVVTDLGNYQGRLTLSGGTINRGQFAIGGEELFIDDVCVFF